MSLTSLLLLCLRMWTKYHPPLSPVFLCSSILGTNDVFGTSCIANKKRRGRMGGYFDLGYYFCYHFFFILQLLVLSYGRAIQNICQTLFLSQCNTPFLHERLAYPHAQMHTCMRLGKEARQGSQPLLHGSS